MVAKCSIGPIWGSWHESCHLTWAGMIGYCGAILDIIYNHCIIIQLHSYFLTKSFYYFSFSSTYERHVLA